MTEPSAVNPLDALVENIARQVRVGFTPQDAAKQLQDILADAARVRAALAEYLRRVGELRWLRDPPILDEPDLPSWYPGACQSDDCNWPTLKRSLIADGWLDDDITSLHGASEKILSRLPAPGLTAFHTRGLVLGYVQSGKTANYTSVIAKAADVNYKVFIVLSGMHEGLRRQTQERLEEQLCRPRSEDWVSMTSLTSDFTRRSAANADFFLTQHHDHRVLLVVKKNQSRLRGLIAWLRSARPAVLAACPILVIDDEADQASVNSGANGRRAINGLIIELLTALPKAAYIGYSATPFANLLIDPSDGDDLYPRDFIVDLPRPPEYFGPERVFGRQRLTQEEGDDIDGLDIIREIPIEDVAAVKPPGRDQADWQPELAPSLAAALDYFVVASAARLARGQRDFSSMLVHTSMYIDAHRRTMVLLEQWLATISAAISRVDEATMERLRGCWESESKRVPAGDVGATPVSFSDLASHLTAVISAMQLIRDDHDSADRLDYDGEPHPILVVGGNTLSRGLTLRGLIVSYFVRTASAYDTLLQMGRWFGYRRGYEDLPRIWMTRELTEYFRDLATVEHEIREDIKLYELDRTTPTTFAVRIRTHPALSITAKAKMLAAVDCEASYSGRRPQMTTYRYRDVDWIRRTRDAAWTLLERAMDSTGAIEESGPSTLVRGVSADTVLSFLGVYPFHERHTELRPDLLTGYIRAQNKDGSLLRWDVAIVGRRRQPGDRLLEVGPGLNTPLLNRAALRDRTDGVDADLGAIMSQADLAVDLDITSAEATSLSSAALMRKRSTDLADVGLLLLYPIAKDSVPQRTGSGRSEVRIPLDASGDLVGVALAFPTASRLTPQKYKSADLARIEREEPDLPDLDADAAEQEEPTGT